MSILKISLFFHSFDHFVLPRISSTFGDSCNFCANTFGSHDFVGEYFLIAAAQTVTQTGGTYGSFGLVGGLVVGGAFQRQDRLAGLENRRRREKRVCSIMKKNPNRVKWRFRKWSTHWLSQCRFVFPTGKFHTISSYSQLASPPNTIAKCFSRENRAHAKSRKRRNNDFGRRYVCNADWC